jgi:hypothetical protein
LRGARETISRCHPVILLEIWQPNRVKVMLILKEFGYTVEKVSGFNFRAIFEG